MGWLNRDAGAATRRISMQVQDAASTEPLHVHLSEGTAAPAGMRPVAEQLGLQGGIGSSCACQLQRLAVCVSCGSPVSRLQQSIAAGFQRLPVAGAQMQSRGFMKLVEWREK